MPNDHDQHHYRLACHQVLYGNPTLLYACLSTFSNAKALQHASRQQLMQHKISAEHRQAIDQALQSKALQQSLQWLEKPQHHLLCFDDAHYPTLLREIPDFPPLLYIAGDPTLLKTPQLAIVGSRDPTPHARTQTARLAQALCTEGLAITSGLACGVDTFAHQSTLQHDGSTIAVIGNGIDVVYPKSNRKLAHAIIEHGCIVSEYPLGTPPRAAHFPQRNRLISGLSLGTLVVEARLKSGTLITARLAMEQNREVFALPGPAGSPYHEGCHHLIRSGAKLVDHCADIVVELPSWLPLSKKCLQKKAPTAAGSSASLMQALDPEAKAVYDYLLSVGHGSQLDVLAACDLGASQAAQALLTLELHKVVTYAKGRYWPITP